MMLHRDFSLYHVTKLADLVPERRLERFSEKKQFGELPSTSIQLMGQVLDEEKIEQDASG